MSNKIHNFVSGVSELFNSRRGVFIPRCHHKERGESQNVYNVTQFYWALKCPSEISPILVPKCQELQRGLSYTPSSDGFLFCMPYIDDKVSRPKDADTVSSVRPLTDFLKGSQDFLCLGYFWIIEELLSNILESIFSPDGM